MRRARHNSSEPLVGTRSLWGASARSVGFALVKGNGAAVSLFHVAVRNPRVHKFFPIRLVSQARVELLGMGLSIQEEIADLSKIRRFLNSGDQPPANTKTSV